MFKFSIKTPIISQAQFDALVVVQPNLAVLEKTLIVDTVYKAEALAKANAREALTVDEYISHVHTVPDETKEFWVTKITIEQLRSVR